ncbi:MAG TPA: fibronectin type III domain-containing protein [Terriglobales bacterium]|nr:fibronectin type III domain-containing protein [Terriglobales bacterium]
MQDRDKDKDNQAKHAQKAAKVKIIHGPVIESTKPTTATIAWSTNVNASTILKYGTNPGDLDQTAEARWGGTTHRVYLRSLKPGTTYYYRIESTQAQGTGSQAVSGVQQFRTPGAAAASAAPVATRSAAANPAYTRGRDMALRNLHQFLVTHPNVKADLKKNPSLAENASYLGHHPGYNQFLQTHRAVKQFIAEDPTFLQSEEAIR